MNNEQFRKSFRYCIPCRQYFISTANISPADSVGGTWERIENRFLKGANSDESSNNIGGDENHYHTVKFTFPEYYGWSNITGTDDGGMSPSSGIIDVAQKLNGYSSKGSSGTTLFWKPMEPWHRGASGTANYTSSIMSQNHATTVQNTYVNVQTGTTSIESSLPPYYIVYIYKRTA